VCSVYGTPGISKCSRLKERLQRRGTLNIALTTRNVSGLRRILWMARDRWVEKLRCPNCRKAGIARLSTTDEFSWEIRMDGVPEGFKVVRSESSGNFYCSSCDRPVEP